MAAKHRVKGYTKRVKGHLVHVAGHLSKNPTKRHKRRR